MAGDLMERTVWRYGWERFKVLARKVIYRLQRFNASGIYGDDYRHKSRCGMSSVMKFSRNPTTNLTVLGT
jgi:hypothetical protein